MRFFKNLFLSIVLILITSCSDDVYIWNEADRVMDYSKTLVGHNVQLVDHLDRILRACEYREQIIAGKDGQMFPVPAKLMKQFIVGMEIDVEEDKKLVGEEYYDEEWAEGIPDNWEEEFLENLEYCPGHAAMDSFVTSFSEETVSFFDYFDERIFEHF